MISYTSFLDAFKDDWEQRSASPDERGRILEHYAKCGPWTDYMLASKGGMLATIADRMRGNPERIGLAYHGRSIYTIDAMLVGAFEPKDLLERMAGGYPGELHALIEHENGEAVEEEMWKLLWWRSPLKIIIFYDYPQTERERSPMKQRWLSEKLSFLHRMWERVNAFHSEDARTKYLLLIGHRQSDTSFPKWKYVVLPDLTPRDLC